MAVSFKFGVCNLLLELLAHAFILVASRKAAGAISAGALESLLNRVYYLLVFIKSYFHNSP